MSTSTINITEFEDTIKEILEGYEGNCNEIVKDAVDDVSKKALKMLKKESPKRTGKYAKGWARKVEDGHFVFDAILYGKKATTYAIAHLLEHDHATRNGGRYIAVKTKHIEPVQEWAGKELLKEIQRKIESEG